MVKGPQKSERAQLGVFLLFGFVIWVFNSFFGCIFGLSWVSKTQMTNPIMEHNRTWLFFGCFLGLRSVPIRFVSFVGRVWLFQAIIGCMVIWLGYLEFRSQKYTQKRVKNPNKQPK